MNESKWGELIYHFTDHNGDEIGIFTNGQEKVIRKKEKVTVQQ